MQNAHVWVPFPIVVVEGNCLSAPPPSRETPPHKREGGKRRRRGERLLNFNYLQKRWGKRVTGEDARREGVGGEEKEMGRRGRPPQIGASFPLNFPPPQPKLPQKKAKKIT